MRAIVGLGNPGPDYLFTRHNAGFILADSLREAWDLDRFRKVSQAQAVRGQVGPHDVMLVKPQTYMNRSGRVVGEIAGIKGFTLSEDLLVLVDEVALPLGTMRFRPGGSSGGHNGLLDIERVLDTREYPRLRIGVGPVPENEEALADYVLGEFSRSEWDALMEYIPTLVEAVDCWLDEGIETAMNRYNRRNTE